jgi:hypothetical protein
MRRECIRNGREACVYIERMRRNSDRLVNKAPY